MTATSALSVALRNPGPLLISVTSPQPMMPHRTGASRLLIRRILRAARAAPARRTKPASGSGRAVQPFLPDIPSDRRRDEFIDRLAGGDAAADVCGADVYQRRLYDALAQELVLARQALPIERPAGPGNDNELDLAQERLGLPPRGEFRHLVGSDQPVDACPPPPLKFTDGVDCVTWRLSAHLKVFDVEPRRAVGCKATHGQTVFWTGHVVRLSQLVRRNGVRKQDHAIESRRVRCRAAGHEMSVMN